MRHCNQGRFSQQMNFIRSQYAQADELPFGDLLSPELVDQLLAEAEVSSNDCIYTPLTTLQLFLWQVTSQDHSCRATVAKFNAHRVASGEPPCSSKTGAYCTARQRLPEVVVKGLMRETGSRLELQAPGLWKWKGRSVKVFDGSTVTMPDTAANQAEFPQQPNQRRGLGFPIARIAAVFSLASGAVLDAGMCRFQGKGQSELGLLRELLHVFLPGDVMLTDRYLCSWFELALQRGGQVDFICRLHQARKIDFPAGTNDMVVLWPKPRRPEWMDPLTYAALPSMMPVRVVRFQVDQAGFRPEWIVVATSLLDADEVSAEDLAGLYRQRWHVELDLRSLKQTLQMDILRCKEPELVRKELWTHLLAYNLVRGVMAQAALQHRVFPRELSFKGALQILTAFQPQLEHADAHRLTSLYRAILAGIAQHRVGDRPNRVEPRARKRRPKPYPLLTKPRAEAKRVLAART